jgi:hypothetical protein
MPPLPRIKPPPPSHYSHIALLSLCACRTHILTTVPPMCCLHPPHHTLLKFPHCGLQVRKSVKLKTLTRVEAFVDSPGQQEYFELTLVQVCSRAGR